MANLTVEIELNADWQNITAALALVAGDEYTVDLIGVTDSGIVYQAVTDNANMPVKITGHPWTTTNSGMAVDSRRITGVANQILWMRVTSSKGILVATPV